MANTVRKKTVCELKIELKAKGIRGFTGLKRDQLVELLESGVSNQPKTKNNRARETAAAPKPDPKPTPKSKPKLLTMKTIMEEIKEEIPMMNIKISVLRRLQTSLNKLIKDPAVFKGEKDNATKRLKLVKAAIKAKTKTTK